MHRASLVLAAIVAACGADVSRAATLFMEPATYFIVGPNIGRNRGQVAAGETAAFTQAGPGGLEQGVLQFDATDQSATYQTWATALGPQQTQSSVFAFANEITIVPEEGVDELGDPVEGWFKLRSSVFASGDGGELSIRTAAGDLVGDEPADEFFLEWTGDESAPLDLAHKQTFNVGDTFVWSVSVDMDRGPALDAQTFADLALSLVLDFSLEDEAVPAPGPLQKADANFDGQVDLADFEILKSHFGSDGQFKDGDFDLDGFVSLADFNLFKENFGQSSAAVPEPASLALLTVGLLALVGSRFREALRAGR